MATVIPNISPQELLGRFRGQIFSARPGYPEVIHLKLVDTDGGEWGFSTFYAEYSPEDPDFFPGKVVCGAGLDPSGKLTISFSDGSEFNVVPIPLEAEEPDDDLETWHLFTPEGLALFYGPEGRWELGLGSDPC